MKIRVIPCYYNQNDSLITKLGNLKIEYAETKSELIKNLLGQAEELIILRSGSIEELRTEIKLARAFNSEEMFFLEKLENLLK